MKRIKLIPLLSFLLFSSQVLRSQSNVSLGDYAGYSGSYNSSFGYRAGDVVTGTGNTFSGYYTGKQTGSADNNVFNGAYSGYTNSTGDYNVYAGYRAGFYATGSFNVLIGSLSGYALSTGSENVFIGVSSGRNTGVGSKNVFLGYGGGYSATGSGNVYMGYLAGYSASGNNKLYIENSSSNSPLIYGEFDNDLVRINGKLGIGTSDFGTGQLVVDGKIRATKISITTDSFPDYVFETGYQLMPLSDLEAFISINRHLPGIKPREEIIKEGLGLGELNIQLLEKIEELTLHIINLDKKRVEIKKQNAEIQSKIEAMQNTI